MKAHRKWLMDYIDGNINVSTYFFPELVNSQKVKSFGLEFIINKIQEIEK
ncbi:TPA: hypothetical protein PP068_004265 [Salmonella bongori]|nr:hypothetical protein [Salmonella bongori]